MVLLPPMVYIRPTGSRMEPKTRRSALFLTGALVGVAYYVGARRLCAKIPLALPLGPVASEFDLARRAAPAADAAMVGRSPGRVPRAPPGAAAERRAGRHVAGVFSQQLLRGAPRRLSHPPVDRRTAALR